MRHRQKCHNRGENRLEDYDRWLLRREIKQQRDLHGTDLSELANVTKNGYLSSMYKVFLIISLELYIYNLLI